MHIPAKFSSLKTIVVSIRDQQTGGATYFPFSSTSLGTFGNFQFRVGARAPYSVVEAAAECCKALGSIGDTQYLANMDLLSWSVTQTQALNATSDPTLQSFPSGTFYPSLDCENFPNASKDAIFAGKNTNSSDIYFNYKCTTAAAFSPRFDAFACFDCLLVSGPLRHVKF
jgi:hypothetical protein